MNHPIRCEALPFPKMSETEAGQAEACTDAANSEFTNVLEAEIDERETEKPKRDEKAGEPWATYGVISAVLQESVPGRNGTSPTGTSSGSSSDIEPVKVFDGSEPPGVAPKGLRERIGAIDPPPTRSRNQTQSGSKILEAAIKPPEQKLPLDSGLAPSGKELFAGNPTETAKSIAGMVAAKGEQMQLASPQQEEKALRKEGSHSLQVDFPAVDFNKPFRVTAELIDREGRARLKENDSDRAPVMMVSTEAPDFQPAPEAQEIELPTSFDTIEVAESIRTHVEMVRTSKAEKLEVVLRPDADTELHLRVEKVDGQIQLQARCERGDFAMLEANWNTVQQILANQGIRVEPLQQGNSATLQGGSDASRNSSNAFGQNGESRSGREKIFTEKTSNLKGARKAARSGFSVRGWQSWA